MPDGDVHIISTFSRKLSLAQRSFHVAHTEALAIIEALEDFDSIIQGRKVKIITDHSNL
jgi:hypothetical protein